MDPKTKAFLKEYGKTVLAARRKAHMTQRDLAKATGYSVSSVGNVEKANSASRKLITAVAAALGLTVDLTGVPLEDGYGPGVIGRTPGDRVTTDSAPEQLPLNLRFLCTLCGETADGKVVGLPLSAKPDAPRIAVCEVCDLAVRQYERLKALEP